MEERTKIFVGLDVHKDSISVAAAESGRGGARLIGKVTHDVNKLLKVLGKIGTAEQLHIVYEAGPTGFGLQRALKERGYVCEIIAPSQIPRRPGARVKTDGRDCIQLAECSRAGQLSAVWIPDPADEAIRDLSRAREDAVNSRVQARHQLKSFLLRHDIRYTGKDERVERCLLPVAVDAELRLRRHADGVHRVLAGGHVRRRTCRAADEGPGGLEYTGWRFEPAVGALQAFQWCGRDHGDRPDGRDRRPRALPASAQAHGLSRPGSFGALEWRTNQPRQHHQDGKRARAPALDRSGLELSLQGSNQPRRVGAPRGAAEVDPNDGMEGAVAADATVCRVARARGAGQQGLRGYYTRAGRLHLGNWPAGPKRERPDKLEIFNLQQGSLR